jgi:trehalose 6-phosphate phosphatase
MMVPPPTPKSPLNVPAAVAIANSLRALSRGTGGDTSAHEGNDRYLSVTAGPALAGRLARLLLPLREAPGSSAVLCDVDGTLAPIVADPGAATVPADAREALRALARRYALVGCVSGRRALDARSIVGVEELAYAGNHGLELLEPGAHQPALDPAAAEKGLGVRRFVLGLDAAALGRDGLELEDKGPIQALHWRRADDTEAAEARARAIAQGAREAGLEPHWGRRVLEIRPLTGINKGTAVRRLLDGATAERTLFAGDDRTDVDAFEALRSMVATGSLRGAVCLGIASQEAPPELAAEADAMVEGTGEFLDVLRVLAQAKGAISGTRRS